MLSRNFWVRILLAIALVVTFAIGGTARAATYMPYNEEQKLFLQAWRIVNQAYLDDTFNHHNWWFIRQDFLEQEQFASREETYAAIEKMLAMLDDPFTRLLKPDQYRSLQVNTAGELSGVGLQIDIDPNTGQLRVVAPLADSPAQAAGIRPGDRIVAIDGVETAQLSLDEAAARMRGAKGTAVTLTIQPAGEGQESIRQVELVRDRIALNPVYAQLDSSQSIPIGYLRLSQFSANAATEVAEAIARLEQAGAQGFILDLRNNPGGLLQAGIEIARLWLDEGTIVYTVDRRGMLGSFDAGGPAVTDAPLVVLVNRGTASASEILAGALQDNARAQLVGEKTFGKGLIQSLFELPDQSGLAITVAKYETPSHKDIHKSGIVPDYIVPQDPIRLPQVGTQADLQYQQALKLLTHNTTVAKVP